jgi:hypothetical protein
MVKQNLHIKDRVDRNASLAHVSGHALVVRVISPVRGEIECDR